MKPYGIPRCIESEYCDVADIKCYGRKTSVGSLKGRSYFRNKQTKRNTRRIWKKKARKLGKDQCLY